MVPAPLATDLLAAVRPLVNHGQVQRSLQQGWQLLVVWIWQWRLDGKIQRIVQQIWGILFVWRQSCWWSWTWWSLCQVWQRQFYIFRPQNDLKLKPWII